MQSKSSVNPEKLVLKRSNSLVELRNRLVNSYNTSAISPIRAIKKDLTFEFSNEILSILSLYTSTNGNEWRSKKNWNSTRRLSEWQGIEVDEDGKIIEIRLLMNGLNGTLPSKFCTNLPKLCYLDLSNNSLTGSIPNNINQFYHLRELKLHYNQLTGSIPSSLGDIISLQGLHLEGNNLSGIYK